MNIGELIRNLKRFPLETEVAVEGIEGHMMEVLNITPMYGDKGKIEVVYLAASEDEWKPEEEEVGE